MPVEPTNTNPEPNPAPEANPAAPAPAAPGGPSPTPPTPQAVKPEGLPDRYWDDTTGLRTKEIADTLSTLEADKAKQADTFKDFPDKPEDAGKFYTMPEQLLPEGMSLPEGTEFKPNQSLLDRALPVFHQYKVPREAFQELARQFNAHEVEQYTAVTKDFTEDNKKLGANADTRRQAVADGLSAIVGPEAAKFIDTGALTSGAVEFFEAIVSKFSAQNTAHPQRNGVDRPPPPPPQTIEQRWYPGNQQRAN